MRRPWFTSLATGALRQLDRWLDALSLFVLVSLRAGVRQEILARDLPSLADESGGHLVARVQGVQ